MVSSTENNVCDIAIAGAGPMGVMTAIKAAQAGFRVFIFDSSPLCSLDKSLQVIWPSPNDLLTRVESHKDRETALKVAKVHREAHSLWLRQFPDVFHEVDCFRMASEPLLQRELRQAWERGYLTDKLTESLYKDIPALMFKAGQLKAALLERLQGAGVTLVRQAVEQLEEEGERCRVTTEAGETYLSEIGFVALSHRVGKLLPERARVLSPMADVLAQYESPKFFKKPFTLRSANGHIAVLGVGRSLAFSGPRFLLPSAGVGKVYSRISSDGAIKKQQFEAFQRSYLSQFASESPLGDLPINDLKLTGFTGYTDSLVRDEFPVLGELAGNGRVFGTFGWLGAGLSAAPWVAWAFLKSLQEGSVSHIPSCFLARRLQDF